MEALGTVDEDRAEALEGGSRGGGDALGLEAPPQAVVVKETWEVPWRGAAFEGQCPGFHLPVCRPLKVAQA